MKIRVGFDIIFACAEATPMVLMLNVHPSRGHDLLMPDTLRVSPVTNFTTFVDGFGNTCVRLVAPKGDLNVATETVIRDSGLPDIVVPTAKETPISELPHHVMQFLRSSRYCEVDRLMPTAWSLFGGTPTGWARVQAIVDFVHDHIAFGYGHARSTRSALDAFEERRGVCRDFAHLAVALCRCMNIPARYCTGYLGDIGVPADPDPMDFSAWFEVYFDGHWYTFDARHNVPRIGRVVIARGRDAGDVAISTTFGPNVLKRFVVQTEELVEAPAASLAPKSPELLVA